MKETSGHSNEIILFRACFIAHLQQRSVGERGGGGRPGEREKRDGMATIVKSKYMGDKYVESWDD